MYVWCLYYVRMQVGCRDKLNTGMALHLFGIPGVFADNSAPASLDNGAGMALVPITSFVMETLDPMIVNLGMARRMAHRSRPMIVM